MTVFAIPVLIVIAAVAQLPGQVTPAPPLPPLPPTMPTVFIGAQFAGGSYMGIWLMEVDAKRAAELDMGEPYGVEVSNVSKGSPAELAGVRKGDVIVEYRSQRVEGQAHFARLVRETPVGREVPLRVMRDGGDETLTVVIGRRPGAEGFSFPCGEGEDCDHSRLIPRADFGLTIPKPRIIMGGQFMGARIEGLEGQLAEYFGVDDGLLVREVEAGSAAARAGIKAGDVIVAINGEKVNDPGDVRRATREDGADGKLQVEVMRNRAKRSLTVETEAAGPTPRKRGARTIRPVGEKL